MAEDLTRRQREVLEIVRNGIEENGFPPTLHEIGRQLGLSSIGAVTDHLDALVRKGALRKGGAKGTARSWQLVEEEREDAFDAGERSAPFVTVPLVGSIAAGVPITALQHVEEQIPVPLALTGSSSECFILRVKGDSMVGDAICDGDLAILKAQSTARSGDIVAALIDEEATLKHYVKIGGKVELHASNPAYAPIPIQTEQSKILGKLVGLMRRFH